MASTGHLAIRREPIEYGIPIASWLPHIDCPSAIIGLLKQLIETGDVEDTRCFVTVPTLARVLEIPLQHAQTLVDVIEAVSEDYQLLLRRGNGINSLNGLHMSHSLYADAVDVHAVALFLFAQLYSRQAARPDTMDVWPASEAGNNNSASSSSNSGAVPMEIGNMIRTGSGASSSSGRSSGSPHTPGAVHFQQQRSNHLVLKELQGHLLQHQQALRGYLDFVERQASTLMQLCQNRPCASEGSMQGVGITAAEFDRLSLLLRPAAEAQSDTEGSPMDVTPSPFNDAGRLSSQVPLFDGVGENGVAPLPALADWLSNNIVDEQPFAEAMASSPMKGVSGHSSSLPPAGIVQSGSMEIQGVCKSTVVRGEDDFAGGVLHVTDCHDSIVYALASLQYASITCCSDCTVVVGAVGKMLRVEKCERLQLIAASVRICISSCHDCIFYLGVNRPPLLIGDNRFIQLAPYNTQYERLVVHLASAGVTPEPNLWDKPVTLAREHGRATPDSGTDGPGGTSSGKARDPVQLLPPDRLVPFMVPFQGGRGPMCGGAASSGATRIAADLGSFMGLGEGGAAHPPLPPSPFRLPPAYEEAKDKKVAAVAELRNAVKSAVLDEGKKKELQSVIQSYFKEWLVSSGNMRQVYDLARMEREEGPSS